MSGHRAQRIDELLSRCEGGVDRMLEILAPFEPRAKKTSTEDVTSNGSGSAGPANLVTPRVQVTRR